MTFQEIYNITFKVSIFDCFMEAYPGITADDFSVRCDDGTEVYVDTWNEAFGPKPTVEDVLIHAPIVFARMKREEINHCRDEEEHYGFDYLGKRFDSDHEAQRRISIAVLSAQSAINAGTPEAFTITWTCMDNTTIQLDAYQMSGMPVAMAQRGAAIHYHAWAFKNSIEAIKSQFINNEIGILEAINAMDQIVWTSPA